MGRGGNRDGRTDSRQTVTGEESSEIVMQEWAAGEVIESLLVRRDLDMAEGILIGLRRCDPNAAYQELLGAAKRHGVGLMAISSALVHIAGIPNAAPTAVAGPAYCAAYREWRDLFDRSRRQTSAGVTQSHRYGAPGRSDERSHGRRRIGRRWPGSRIPQYAENLKRRPPVPTSV